MKPEKDEDHDIHAEKWTFAYVMIVLANLLFAFVFYIISSIYGGD